MDKKTSKNNAVYRNDYKLRAILLTYANENHFIKTYIKPYFRGIYRYINSFLPYPRDFILKRVPKNGKCCEVGVWTGDFSKRIYEICNPSELVLIDPWFYFTKENYFDKKKIGKYTQEAQDSRYKQVINMFQNEINTQKVKIRRETSTEAAVHFPDNYFDFVYIDGNHDYEYVLNDIKIYYEKTKSGGILSGDDYRLPDVQKALYEFVERKGLKNRLEVKNDQFVIRKP